MARRQDQPNDPQEVDTTLKTLFGKHASSIIPHLLPDVEVLSEQNIELNRSTIRADLAFKVRYYGRIYIVNMELQTRGTIELRLLQYHVGFLAKYKLPVISVVLYPFETQVTEPPYVEMGNNGPLLTFEYLRLCLWKMEAQPLMEQQIVLLYPLLPAMKGTSVPLLKQALKEMLQFHQSRREFGDALIFFKRILRRSKALTRKEKSEIEEEIQMRYNYKWHIHDNPDVRKVVRQAKEEALKEGEAKGLKEGVVKGLKEGVIKGEVEGLQLSVLMIIGKRFPAAAQETQLLVEQIKGPEYLKQLILDLLTIETEPELLQLLHKFQPQQELRQLLSQVKAIQPQPETP